MSQQFSENHESGREKLHLTDKAVQQFSELTSPRPDCDPLLEQVRQRFRQLAEEAVAKCDLMPEMARTIFRSLELGLAQTLKEDGDTIQRRFGEELEDALKYVATRLYETYQQITARAVDQTKTQLQNLALLQMQALEIMVPVLKQRQLPESTSPVASAAQLKTFCNLLNEGLDLAQFAEKAVEKRNQPLYLKNHHSSQLKLRDAGRLLRKMLREAGPSVSDLSIGLTGFQLELAAQNGSIRMFVKALSALEAAAKSPQHREEALNPHCLIEDLVPTLFNRHFEFTITHDPTLPKRESQKLVMAAHDMMWDKAKGPIADLLDRPDRLLPAELKKLTEQQLQKAIEQVNQAFLREKVVIKITSNKIKETTRRRW